VAAGVAAAGTGGGVPLGAAEEERPRVEVTEQVLARVLLVGVADPEPRIRRALFRALSPAFDAYLAQADSLQLLLMALADGAPAVRAGAVRVLGRVAGRNPAHVLPVLRTLLAEQLTTIEHSPSARCKADAARLLTQLICCASKLTRPYAMPILQAHKPPPCRRLSSPDPP
jgi:FKBP12-rapamycin complex-associated protein